MPARDDEKLEETICLGKSEMLMLVGKVATNGNK